MCVVRKATFPISKVVLLLSVGANDAMLQAVPSNNVLFRWDGGGKRMLSKNSMIHEQVHIVNVLHAAACL